MEDVSSKPRENDDNPHDFGQQMEGQKEYPQYSDKLDDTQSSIPQRTEGGNTPGSKGLNV